MGKTRTIQVINNRLQFRCPECKTRKYSSIQRNLRRKNIRCSRCGEITKCIVERRARPRTLHGGKIIMITQAGSSMEVFLHDISLAGIGIDMPLKTLRSNKMKAGRQVRFKCNWNPSLFNKGSFMVNNIKDHRLGIEKIGR